MSVSEKINQKYPGKPKNPRPETANTNNVRFADFKNSIALDAFTSTAHTSNNIYNCTDTRDLERLNKDINNLLNTY